MSQRPSACIPPPTDYTPKPSTHLASSRYKARPNRARHGHRSGGHEQGRQSSSISFHSDKQSSDLGHDTLVRQQPRDRFYRSDDDDYFARVQDEEECAGGEINSNATNEVKSTECEDTDEDDPLDAYMKSLEGNSKSGANSNSMNPSDVVSCKEESQSIKSPAGPETERARAIRLDIEDGDDIEESYYKYVEERKGKTMEELEEDERLEQVEYDKDGNITGLRKIKREVAPLPPVDHSKIVYDEFEKKFYQEHEEISKLSDEQTKELRAKLEIRVSGDSPPRPVCSFAHFKFDEKLMKVIRKSEYFQPTPIQAQAIPAALLGRNMIGIAMTGSGKTAAYLWPMIVHIMHQRKLKQGDGPIGLILVPTRELALQVYGEARKFSNSYKFSVVCAYGGGSRYEQSRDLEAGAEIVVATPGRIIDLIKSSATNLRRVTYLVLDEADRFFEMGFEAQVRSICDQIRPDRQTLLFSATFKQRVEQLARTVTDNPIKIIQKTLGEANEDVTQHAVVFTEATKKWNWLEDRFVEFTSSGSVLIFVTRIANSEELQKRLVDSGRITLLLHGDMEQSERNRVITAFKRKECDVMIATDVAARGLDISHIKTVINYDVARDIETHIHRIGRTGRAGSKGYAYTLLSVEKDREFAGHLVKNFESSNQKVDDDLLRLAMRSHTFRKSVERNNQKRTKHHHNERDHHRKGHSSHYDLSHQSVDRRSSSGHSDHARYYHSDRDGSQHRSYEQNSGTSSMAKSDRPRSPGSTITTSSIKEGPGGRKYTTRIEKTKPTYSFKVQTQTTTQSAIPEEVELDGKHFKKWPGILKLLQLAIAILCMIFFSPPLTWFTRVLCAVVASCFAITIFVCLFYLFTLRRVVMPSWHWLKIEMHYTNIAAAFYLVASLLQLIYTNKEEYKISLAFHDYEHNYLIAGVLGLINFVLYGLGGQLLDNKLKAQRARQTKVCIIRTTLDRKGKPVKKTIKKAQRVKVHRIDVV